MRFQKQLFRHAPDEGVYGDCVRTVLACFLDLRPAEVPHFALQHWNDTQAWAQAQREFLASHGFTEITFAYSGAAPLEQVLSCIGSWNPTTHYILSGESRNGTDHVVICRGDRIVWDPALDESGIVGPCSDGNWWIHFLASDRFNVDEEARCPSTASTD